MFRKCSAGIVGGLAIVALGCSGGDASLEATGRAATESLSVFGPECPTNKAIWLAPSHGAIAPVAGHGGTWTAEHLFKSGAPGLAGYWSFTWTSAGGSQPDFAALGTFAAGINATPVQKDCAAVTALATVTDGVWTTMRSKNAERTSKLAVLPGGTMSPVRVAVVDSAATAYASTTTNDNFDHGRTVGRSIRELSCPSDGSGGIASLLSIGGVVPVGTAPPPCVGQVTNFPALIHLTPTTTDVVYGGYYGTESELALAIVRAVDSWIAEPSATRPPHLVVNLSLGWDSGQGYGGEYDVPGSLAPAARSVLAAITHADCRGALVVAAAGNKSTPSSSGPMFPAAWEIHPAPTAAECAAFEGAATLPADPATVTYRPLVHAVGALDAVDAPLSNTRALGRPRMAAYGEDVVTTDARSVHTDMLTGSSMAAANVSGIAAAAWGYKPAATANEIMQLVYDHAVALTDAADFSFTAAHPIIHRASLCHAVKAAMNGTFTCATPRAFAGSEVSFDWASLDPGFAMTPLAALTTTASSLPTSVGGVSSPWVTSQPGSPTCTTCIFKSTRTAYIGTNPMPATYSVSSAIITVKTKVSALSTVSEYYKFNPPLFPATNALNYAVTLPPSTVSGTVTSATITWNVHTTASTTTYQTTAPLALVP